MERRDFVKSGLAGAAIGLVSSSMAVAENHEHAHGHKTKPNIPAASPEFKEGRGHRP